jgi:hypothetical protein
MRWKGMATMCKKRSTVYSVRSKLHNRIVYCLVLFLSLLHVPFRSFNRGFRSLSFPRPYDNLYIFNIVLISSRMLPMQLMISKYFFNLMDPRLLCGAVNIFTTHISFFQPFCLCIRKWAHRLRPVPIDSFSYPPPSSFRTSYSHPFPRLTRLFTRFEYLYNRPNYFFGRAPDGSVPLLSLSCEGSLPLARPLYSKSLSNNDSHSHLALAASENQK